jgi:hypothetical protein
VDVNPESEAKTLFLHSIFAQGSYWFNVSMNLPTPGCCGLSVELGFWERMELTVVDFKNLPKRPRGSVCIPGTMDVTKAMSRLRIQNYVLNTAGWLVTSRSYWVEKEFGRLYWPDSFKALVGVKFRAFWETGRVIFRTLKDENKIKFDESSTEKFWSQ